MIHGDHRQGKQGDIADKGGQGAGDDRLHTADVRRHPGNGFSLPVSCEEPVGHIQEVPEHLVPHIEGNVLGHPDVQPGLEHPDEVGEYQHAEGRADKPDEDVKVASDKPVVHDSAHQYRRHYRQP